MQVIPSCGVEACPWVAARDPLHGRPARQAARARAVMRVWGRVEDVWQDVLHGQGRALFIPSFVVYRQFQ